ncbi:hypothetical protein N0V83_008067 [Neocucurbitaria cava]|uniref:protein-histidine N-methyltransferase n=1 Tax=Neocucurbitaria cava TaxID=798079 RepID=A0A9W8Y4C8_9PLEO|nr:hypothetical protein N0V83_008067 [Neocucurbitaria cava]
MQGVPTKLIDRRFCVLYLAYPEPAPNERRIDPSLGYTGLTMAFSFGFSGDDIEEDPNDVVPETQEANASGSDDPPPIAARTHDLDELLSTLPDKISYTNITITSPKGFTVRLPRRELFDVRLQLMAEDDGSSSNPLTGLDESDLRPNLYEGGYKTWECSIDLVKYLLDRGPRKDLDDLVRVNHVIEMGCGSALPSLLLFQYALKNSLPMYFTLTDYNADVLRLVTLPNLLLTWCATLDEEQNRDLFPETGNPLCQQRQRTSESSNSNEKADENESENGSNGDIYLSPALLQSFKQTLTSTGVTLTLLSGSWLPTPHSSPSSPPRPTSTPSSSAPKQSTVPPPCPHSPRRLPR